MIVESIYADVMKAVAAKGKMLYDMRHDLPLPVFRRLPLR